MGKRIILISSFALSAFLFSCSTKEEKKQDDTPVQSETPKVKVPEFNADSAYSFVKSQIEFGPRVPNTSAHVKCGDYLLAKLNQYCDTVYVQSGIVNAFDGTRLKFRNFIGSFGKGGKRILLFAHWDTRPWADQDTKDKDKPGLGTDDGGSGVGVLLEVARQLSLQKPDVGVDIAFFDAEDWGKEGGGEGAEDSYALGTQYWTRNPHIAGYDASYGILLDMVGSKGAQFRLEGGSMENASFVVQKVWSAGQALGYSNFFLNQQGGWITDDHVYVNRMGIPSIDIIASDPGSRSGFPKHWHTHNDNIDVIDPVTLNAVGQTLLKVIYEE